ncbi:DUF1566 domain-containing protein [Roseateles sp. UC29_93]|uniref:DUF1566 domain-containing protein n=1 Tax=Roseateles sp. UC29_93 TaxID=3350177 RepID=UPI00367286E4
MSTDTITLASLPALGAEWPADPESVSIGRYFGVTTSPDGGLFALVLLNAQPGQELTWAEAMAWAEGVGGELPNRVESALLYANAKDRFERDWYWTREQYSALYAWYQSFDDGYQYNGGKGYEYRARAVRRFKLIA